jgi:hypothetical protein
MSSKGGGWLRGDDACEWANQVGAGGALVVKRAAELALSNRAVYLG